MESEGPLPRFGAHFQFLAVIPYLPCFAELAYRANGWDALSIRSRHDGSEFGSGFQPLASACLHSTHLPVETGRVLSQLIA